MKKFLQFVIVSLLPFWSFSQKNFTQFVNPIIGSAQHGHVFVGANVPFGAIQVGPTQNTQGWDWCSGYNYADSAIIGFAQTHLSGTGIGDLGDVMMMPVTGNVKPVPGTNGDEASGYYSFFSHANEEAKAGYYKVKLDRYNIVAEMTATARTAFHQYQYPAAEKASIIFDLQRGIGWDGSYATYIRQVNETTLEGYRFSRGWANDQRVFFYATFSKPIKGIQFFEKDSLLGASIEQPVKNLKAMVDFGNTSTGEYIQTKIALSPVNTFNAKLNLESEIPAWDFNLVRSNADKAWNKELGKVDITSYDSNHITKFYTALYHSMIAPSLFNDVNGDYYGTDKQIHKAAKFQNYTTFSLWDTYRAAHPLMTVIHAEKVNDMINTMLAIYREQGKLPVWHLMANETNTMVGSPGVIVVGDAIMKGFTGFDVNEAYEAMKSSQLSKKDTNIAMITSNGFLPADKFNESVATAMEHAIADYAVALVAKKLGKQNDYDYWIKRANAYQHYFDPKVGFMRGKLSSGNWREPFDPFEASHRTNDYTEGNAWQYLWLVPQNVEELIKLLGGEQKFENKLDRLFEVEGHMGENASPDISGLIGQYAHGNEPSHHITYMYSFIGKPWKGADKMRFILDSMYTIKPDGLCGNEDVGQMSAWYILSALGFYPLNPASGMFIFGSPIINSATIETGNKAFRISVSNNGKGNKYIQSVKLNGKSYTKSYLMYDEIMKGGDLQITMGNKPSKTFGVAKANRPYSLQ